MLHLPGSCINLLGAADSGDFVFDSGRATSVAVYICIIIYMKNLQATDARTHLSRPSPAPEAGLGGRTAAIPEARVGH